MSKKKDLVFLHFTKSAIERLEYTMIRIPLRNLLFSIAIGLILLYPSFNFAQEAAGNLTLKQTIEAAIKANLRLQQSQDEVEAAQANKKARTTEFFPTLNARYSYLKRDNPTTTVFGTPQTGTG